MTLSEQAMRSRFLNVVVAARVGDAMGSPTEGMSVDLILERFGWVSTFSGQGTDDSLMATVLARALIESGPFTSADTWAEWLLREHGSMLDQSRYFFVSVIHTMEKLRRGYRPSEVGFGNMPSSSAAMCIWPVSLIHAANPDAAARQAYELASLLHVPPTDHCADAAAALAAAISAAFLAGARLGTCIENALRCIRSTSGEPFRRTLLGAIELATRADSYVEFRSQFQSRYSRPIFCDAMETVPAAFGLAMLADGDVKNAVEYGANFGRDADTIASMVGALTGALADDPPAEWTAALDEAQLLAAQDLAADLFNSAVDRARASVDRNIQVLALLQEA